jgi:Bacteriophage holin family
MDFTKLLTNTSFIALIIMPLVLIFVDIVSGIAKAIKLHDFSYRRVADFLGTSFLKYLVAFTASLVVFLIAGSAKAASVACWLGMGSLSLSLTASIIENISALGLPPGIEKEADVIVKDIADQSTKPFAAVTVEMSSVRAARLCMMEQTMKMPAIRRAQW